MCAYQGKEGGEKNLEIQLNPDLTPDKHLHTETVRVFSSDNGRLF